MPLVATPAHGPAANGAWRENPTVGLAGTDEGRGDGRTLVALAVAVGLLSGALVYVLRPADDAPRSSEWVGDLALSVWYTLPALVALLALRGRPVLLGAAAGLSALAGSSSLSSIAVLLWVPGLLYLMAYERVRPAPPARVRAGLVVIATVALGVLAFVVLLIHQSPQCFTSARGTRCASDVISTREALGAVGVMVVTLLAAAWMGAPKAPRAVTAR